MSLRNIINSTIVGSMLVAAPMNTMLAEPKAETHDITEDFREALGYLDEVKRYLRMLDEPETEMPELTRRYQGYWLSEEEHVQVKDHVKAGLLKEFEIRPYLGFMALMRHRELIDFVAEYYNVDSAQILQIMNQETSFDIGMRGSSGERGIGQKMPKTARNLVNRITDENNELYYPFLDKEDYRFRKLSSDYRLNIILTAAMIRTADRNLDKALADAGLTREEFAEKVRKAGSKETFWYLGNKKSERFSYYHVDKDLRNEINDFWKDHEVNENDLMYLAYNGGRGSVRNLMKRKAVSEVLQINFYNYSRRKDDIAHYLALYNGDEYPEMTPEDVFADAEPVTEEITPSCIIP